MKTCSRIQADLAAFALGELEPAAKPELQAHLADCPCCRQQLAELQEVTRNLGAAPFTPEIEVSPGFHQRLLRQLEKPAGPVSGWEYFRHLLAGWRTVTPILATLGVVLLVQAIWFPRRPTPAPLVATAGLTLQAAPVAADAAPTLGHYHQAAGISFEALDTLLTLEATTGNTTHAFGPSTLALALATE